MAKHKGGLLRQLTISLGLAIVFLSLSSFFYQYQVEKRTLMGHIRADLTRQVSLLRTSLNAAATNEKREQVARQYVETLKFLEQDGQEVIIVDKDSKVIAASSDEKPGSEYTNDLLRSVLRPGAPSSGMRIQVGDRYHIAMPWYASVAGTEVEGGILARQPLTAVGKLARSLMLNAFLLLGSTLVIIVVVVHLVLRLKVHRPMQAIFMQEYRIREGDLAKIEAEDPANEFSDLYGMYNEMVTRIAEQKKAILDQKDHVALAHIVRQAIARLTGPLDDILSESRDLLEHQSSLSEADRATLRKIIGNITRIARELKAIVVEGDKSATWLKREAEKIHEYDKQSEANTEQD